MIRLLTAGLFLILFLLASIPMIFVEWIIGKISPKTRDISSLRIVQWAFRVVAFLSGCKVTVIGEEKIPKDRTLLYVSNHRSVFDIVLTYARCPKLTGYMAKKETKKLPVISTWMKYLYCSFVDRNNTKEAIKSVLDCIQKIRDGIDIFIFPEGTRSKGDQTELLPFKNGAFKIATKTNCVIQPVAITGTSGIFEEHLPFIRKQAVTIEYLPAIDVTTLDADARDHLDATCHALIREAVIRNAATRIS